ncbi:hypothetical protein ACWEV4_00830 [Streptomyces sp. NPDC003860]
MVASHDLPLLRSIGITRWLLMDGTLRDTTAQEVADAVAKR